MIDNAVNLLLNTKVQILNEIYCDPESKDLLKLTRREHADVDSDADEERFFTPLFRECHECDLEVESKERTLPKLVAPTASMGTDSESETEEEILYEDCD